MKTYALLSALCVSAASYAAPPATEPAGREENLSNVTQLTNGFDKAGEAYFSPDMKWIIFQGAPKGAAQYQMYVAKLKRKGDAISGIEAPIQISPEPSRNTCGFFSPDGNSLIFASTFGKEKPDEPNSGYQRQGGNYRWAFPDGMEIFSCAGWESYVNDVPAGGKVSLLEQRTSNRLTSNDVYDAECAFSPDGKWICYTSIADGNPDVYVMKVDRQLFHLGANPQGGVPAYFHLVATGSPIRITSSPGYDGGPFFSPDGKRLVFRSDRQKNDLLQVFVGDLAFDEKGDITGLKAEHQLTSDVNVNWGPYWHPDGKHLIYATSKHGHANYELYLMRDDGSHATRITYSPGADILPVFSPDGKYLMWTSKRSKDNTSQVYIAGFKMPAGE